MLLRTFGMLYKQLLFRFSEYNPETSGQKLTMLFSKYDVQLIKAREIEDKIERSKKLAALQSQLQKEAKVIEEEAKTERVKGYILQNMATTQEEQANQQKLKRKRERQSSENFIPNHLVIKKLRMGDKRILFMGINEENQDHCIYVKRTAEKMKIKTAVAALPPDMPYFIKSEGTFMDQWKKFLMVPGYAQNHAKFYLNPVARCLEDVCLKKQYIDMVRNSLNKSKQFTEMMYSILQYEPRNKNFVPNGLLTPLLISNINEIFFIDFPVIKEREMWAMTIPLDKMRELFELYKEQNKKKKTYFDPRVLFPKQSIQHKFNHLTNNLKLVASKQQTNEPILFVCPSEYSQLFSLQWPKQKDIIHYFDLAPYKTSEKPQITFIEFIQKLVIMDIILEPIVTKYFVRYDSFPFRGSGTIGGNEHIGKIFLVWTHFYNKYYEAL